MTMLHHGNIGLYNAACIELLTINIGLYNAACIELLTITVYDAVGTISTDFKHLNVFVVFG